MTHGLFRRFAAPAAACLVLAAGCSDEDEDRAVAAADVVFVGASITEAWDFAHYFPGRSFAKVVHFDWRKTDAWNHVAARRPRLVVVKECAAYFDAAGDTPLADFQAEMEAMAARIRGAGMTPVLATTIPVDVGAGDCTQAQLDDIAAFNAWVRSYCLAQGLVCLDLAAAVQDAEGQLPSDCHDGDGLHPNTTGYDRLSPAVLPALIAAGPVWVLAPRRVQVLVEGL